MAWNASEEGGRCVRAMRRRTFSSSIPLGVLAVGIAACGNSQHSPEWVFELTLVQEYGHATLQEPPGAQLSETARRVEGGVLGGVAGVAQGKDSTVYILDHRWYKIVAFAPDGSLRGVIVSGEGDGPGEFRTPIDLAVTSGGLVVVLDYEHRRLSHFSLEQGFVGSTNVEISAPFRLAIVEDRIWISRPINPQASPIERAIAFSATGERLGSVPPLPAADRPFGAPPRTSVTREGVLLLPLRQPGLWEEWDGTTLKRFGVELFPDLTPPQVRQEGQVTYIGTSEANTSGIAALPNGLRLLLYYTAQLDAEGFPERGSVEWKLAVLDRTGTKIGTCDLPDGIEPTGRVFYVSPITGNLMFDVTEPYPRVLEFAIQEVRMDES